MNIVYGPNEAGKSTVHSFIRGMFFGMDKKRGRASKDNLYEKYKTWEGSTIGIVYNTSAEEITVDLTGTELEAMGIRGYLTPNGETITLTDGKLVMPAKSICFLK